MVLVGNLETQPIPSAKIILSGYERKLYGQLFPNNLNSLDTELSPYFTT